MIKNIVFDIGDVLVGYNPEKYIKQNDMKIERVNKANDILIKDNNWREYLNGNIKVEKLVQYFEERYPELKKEFKVLLLKKYNKYILYEVKANTTLLKELSNKYHIYLLSNITKETFENIKIEYDFMQYIKGGVYSYQEHLSKPEPKIYQKLIEKYQLNPSETIYIDDRKKNIEISKKLGMIGIQYEEGISLKEKLGGILD